MTNKNLDYQKRVRELQHDHQDEILRYKGKLTTLDFELKNKNTQIDILNNKLRKTEQELEMTRTRLGHQDV